MHVEQFIRSNTKPIDASQRCIALLYERKRPKICTRRIIKSQVNFTHVEEQAQFISWMQYFVTGQETFKCWVTNGFKERHKLAEKIRRLRWFLRKLASRSFTFLLSQESARSWHASWKKSRAKTDSSRCNSYQPVFILFFF